MDAMAGRGERVTRQDCDGGEEKARLPLCGTRRVTDAPVTCVTHASVESAVFAGNVLWRGRSSEPITTNRWASPGQQAQPKIQDQA